MPVRDVFDNISPVDYRYYDEEAESYLSENAFTRYKLRVEFALAKAQHRRGMCPDDTLEEIRKACEKVTTEEVYTEENRIKHDIRALVNMIRRLVSNKAKPFVHLSATSFDISDTANAARYKDVITNVLIPNLIKLEEALIKIALRESETPQVGRTHGQHAVPITFGFAIAEYVSRLGNSIEKLEELTTEIPGKFSGAVGAYNASSLFFDDPEAFEAEVLAELGLKPAEHSTQIVPPEALLRVFCEITIATGVLANLSDDIRNLQRTEIGEVGEAFEEGQVGSSTLAQKQNPINVENSKSMWKIVMPRIITMFMDQISDHQRDLTNSASARTYGETIGYAVAIAKRLTRTMSKLEVHHDNMKRNLAMQRGLIAAEPLYIILAAQGHPDAHEKVRVLTLEARKTNAPLERVALADPELADYISNMTPQQRQILPDPSQYTGIAASKAKSVALRWKQKFGL